MSSVSLWLVTLMNTPLVTADYLCLLVYLAGILALGLWVGRRLHSGKDYFLAGRSLPWWAVGMSLVATDIGGPDIIGVGGAAYRHGLAVGNFEWIGCVPAMILAAFVVIPYFWRLGIYTIPEFMERRFNASVRSALALCWFLFMACNLGVMLFASAQMMVSLVGLSLAWSILLTAALVGAYTIVGGLAAVVYTDTVQCGVMIAGCLLLVVLGVARAGGIGPLRRQIHEAVEQQQAQRGEKAEANAEEYTRLVLPVDTKSPFPWTGILFGLAFILSPAYWMGNQAIVQRSLGTRSEFEAKAAYVWGALLKNTIPLLIAVPGLIALAQHPNLKDGDRALPVLVGSLLPAGLRGIFLAAFLAALMSSVDSYLNSASTLLSRDLYQRFLAPDASEKRLLLVGRLTTAGLVGWGIGFAFLIVQMDNPGIYAIFQTMMSFFQGPALAILLAGLLWRRANGPGALIGFLTGVAVAVSLYLLSREDVSAWLGWEPLFRIESPFLYFSIWAFLASVVVLLIVSLVTRPEPEEKTRHVVFGNAGESTP
jgi:SSS family solute:Na+ symporter